jgi:hypothetical protein
MFKVGDIVDRISTAGMPRCQLGIIVRTNEIVVDLVKNFVLHEYWIYWPETKKIEYEVGDRYLKCSK